MSGISLCRSLSHCNDIQTKLLALNVFLSNISGYYLSLLFGCNIPYCSDHIIVRHFYNGILNYNYYNIRSDLLRVKGTYYRRCVLLFAFWYNELKNWNRQKLNIWNVLTQKLLNQIFFCDLLHNNEFLLFSKFYLKFHQGN